MGLADLMLYGTVIATGLAVWLLIRSLFPESFLREVRARSAESKKAYEEQLAVRGAVTQRPPTALGAFGGAIVSAIGDYNAGFVSENYRAKMLRKFTAMGQPEMRAEDFIARQWIFAAFFTFVFWVAINALGKSPYYMLAGTALGVLFPHIWLRDQISKRQREITRALPYHIDLLTLSVEAGLDFLAALGTVVEKGQPGALIEELNLVLSEVKLGKTRAEALRNLADRVQVSEVSAFVSNLVQADQMGTSMGKVLRIQSTQMRINRSHLAEKLANEAPVKMLLPLIACIFPTVFLVLFGPIVYRLMHGG